MNDEWREPHREFQIADSDFDAIQTSPWRRARDSQSSSIFLRPAVKEASIFQAKRGINVWSRMRALVVRLRTLQGETGQAKPSWEFASL